MPQASNIIGNEYTKTDSVVTDDRIGCWKNSALGWRALNGVIGGNNATNVHLSSTTL